MHKLLLFSVSTLLAGSLASPALAQFGEPRNDFGIALGHVHLTVRDVDAQRRFFTEALGGTLVTGVGVTLVQFPGIYVVLDQGAPSGPPAGAVVDHFGFVLKDIAAARTKWKAANIEYTVGANNPNQGYVLGPDGIRVEVFGDASLPGPVGMDHIHLYVPRPDIPAIQAWYERVFGGLVGTRKTVANPGVTACVYFHRFNVSFSPSDVKRAPSRGRSLDHFGFEVRNLDEFVKRVEALGVKLDSMPGPISNSNIKAAQLTDPWGTSIEVTENLDALTR